MYAEISTFNVVPWEIILVIYKMLDFPSRINFASSCKKNRKLIRLPDIRTFSLYRAMAFRDIVYFICDDLTMFSHNIQELELITINTLSYVFDFSFFDLDFDFPNLKKLKIISNLTIVLNKWKMPRLIHLDVTRCIYCIFDDCNFPMLEYLYILDRVLPLRFCNLSKNVKIVIPYGSMKKETNLQDLILSEKNDARIMNNDDYFRNLKDVLCSLCHGICNISKLAAQCRDCGVHRLLFTQELAELHHYPSCKMSHPLLIYMGRSGTGWGYCPQCKISSNGLTRLQMYAAGKIKGTDKYPLID